MTLTAPGSTQADSTHPGPVPPSPARGLVCRNCGATFGLIAEHACAECFGPLEVDYDPELMRAVTREQIEAGPQNIWRYAGLLPVGQDPAARVGFPSFVFIPSDLEPGKVVQSAVYGQTLVAVDGSYDDVNRLTSELAETDEFEDTAFVNQNVRPYYAEGSKTMGYEIAEQLGWRIPAQVVIPMASGSLLTKVDKAWRELTAAGIVAGTPWAVFGAQSAGCDPIATAFDNGWDVVKPVKPTGIAKSLNIGNPADGPSALDAIRRPGGSVGRLDDAQIVQGIRDLARTTGVFAETAGGVTTAVLR